MSDREAVFAVMGDWGEATDARDADRLARLFTPDGRLHFVFHETITGRDAIGDAFRGVFAAVEMGPWLADCHTVEIYGDRAHAICDFTETQRPRDGSQGSEIHGRAIYLLRRVPGEGWLIEHGISHRRAKDTPLDA